MDQPEEHTLSDGAPLRIEQVIGENIKFLRGGMSQTDLGKRLGELLGKEWSAQTVSAAEKGNRSFIAAEVFALAQVFETTVQTLFRRYDGGDIIISDQFTLSADQVTAMTMAISGARAVEDAMEAKEILGLAVAKNALSARHLKEAAEQLEGGQAAIRTALSRLSTLQASPESLIDPKEGDLA